MGEGLWAIVPHDGRESKASQRLKKEEGPDLVLCTDWETRGQRGTVPGSGANSRSVVTLGLDTRVPFSGPGSLMRLTRKLTTSSLLNPSPCYCKPPSPQKKKKQRSELTGLCNSSDFRDRCGHGSRDFLPTLSPHRPTVTKVILLGKQC